MRLLRRMRHDERGSMVLALLAVIVTGGLATVLVASTVANQRATRFDDNYVAAVHAAELGLHQALYLLDEGLVTGVHASPQAVTVGKASAEWTAVADAASPGGWIITSTGTVNGQTRTVEVTAVQRKRFPSAIYTEVNMHLSGEETLISYNGDSPEPYLRSGGALQPAASTIPNPPKPYDPLKLANDENLKFITSTLESCPQPLTEWRASQHGGLLDLGGGTHCFSKLVFDQDTRVVARTTNPVQLYIQGRIEFLNKAYVIVVDSAGSLTSTRAASAFQVYSTGDAVVFSRQHEVTGAYYAPAADCRGNPSMPHVRIYGALVCGTLKTNGRFNFEYDSRISDITAGSPEIQGWTEL